MSQLSLLKVLSQLHSPTVYLTLRIDTPPETPSRVSRLVEDNFAQATDAVRPATNSTVSERPKDCKTQSNLGALKWQISVSPATAAWAEGNQSFTDLHMAPDTTPIEGPGAGGPGTRGSWEKRGTQKHRRTDKLLEEKLERRVQETLRRNDLKARIRGPEK
ncbi:unnamed protein product [Tuber aestivum]|uniref:Uncharacterized protein n=1 Tax=Tuber aestivum TaxID=59557 RepID=A0A292PSE3_9PEZI|nr:unnamed protein product [Tuber aestivum]